MFTKRGTVPQSQPVGIAVLTDNLIKNRVTLPTHNAKQNIGSKSETSKRLIKEVVGRNKIASNPRNFNTRVPIKVLRTCTQTSSDTIIEKSETNQSYIQRSIPVVQRRLPTLEPKNQVSQDIRVKRICAANEDSNLIHIVVDETFRVPPK